MLTTHTKELSKLLQEEKLLAEKIKMLKEQVIDEMKVEGLDSYKTDYGSFSIGRRKSYTYTAAVKALEEQVKIKKVEEEEKGLADVKVTEYLSARV